MDVIGYVRCSTKEQAMEGHSLDLQRAKIIEEAATRRWTVAHWVEDAGKSGKTRSTRHKVRARAGARQG